ncbi:formate hydrogenlyase subunit 4 [Dissulfurispira thermophila]|uniref:Formate hydrogenlyase subunit 4 n=2 Tax=root TaxID=1 RepID=A0A7G1GZ74_9BACT|nr:NADH-quinone oxidoreductase subunit H [Dissulfurispira thermophila]BCB95684.1 formate hydrogenlyase subunit 4 [Dissulfurispira thermophila]
MSGFIIEILQVIILIGLAPMFAGWVKMLKCWSQGRSSAGVLQPYRDLLKLFSKDVILSENASWIFRFTPYLVFGTVVLAGGIIPMLSTDLPLSLTADVIVLVALFAIARFFTALAGMDIGTAFGGMGSSREMMVASLAEPAMLMAIFTISLACGSTSLSHIVEVIYTPASIVKPSVVFAFISFVLITLAETGRIPVDNPATHLELTMIHEAMILEYSGRHLALIEWASMMKFFLFMAIGAALFMPWGIASINTPESIPMAFVYLILKIGASGIVLVLIETGLAKMRLFRLTEFLGSAFLMATLGMLSFFILE